MITLLDRPVQELEAKFLMAPGAEPERVLRRLQESLVWAGFRVQPVTRRRHSDTYFDTPDQTLRRAGWSLRERDDGCGRCLGLKEINRARAGIFDRRELFQPLDSKADGALRPPQGAIQQRLSELLTPGADLAPLFHVITERTVYRLAHPDHPGSRLELAFDCSRSGELSTPFIELEIELEEGPHELLADALAVAELEPGLLSARLSKYERGLITTKCATLNPGCTTREAGPAANALEAASDHLKSQLAQIRLFEPYAWEGIDPEGVHQMRIAARRARVGLRTFERVLPPAEAGQVAGELRQLAATLGAVRDLDVHLSHCADYRKLLKPTQQERLLGYEQKIQHIHREKRCNLLKLLDGGQFRTLVDRYRTLLATAARAANGSSLRLDTVARDAVGASARKLEQLGRGIASGRLSALELHRLRLAAKRLRYQLEYLQEAYAGSRSQAHGDGPSNRPTGASSAGFGAPLAALRALQERLGGYQDACRARAYLEAYRDGDANDKRQRRLIGQLIVFEKQRARKELAQLPCDWQVVRAASVGLVERL